MSTEHVATICVTVNVSDAPVDFANMLYAHPDVEDVVEREDYGVIGLSLLDCESISDIPVLGVLQQQIDWAKEVLNTYAPDAKTSLQLVCWSY